MAEKLKGTNVSSRIVPFTKDDKYATHDEEFGRGGYRSVATVAEMNAIPEERRKEGMLVNVMGDKTYKLVNGIFVDAGFVDTVYKTTLSFENISYRSDKRITAAEREEVKNIIEQYKAGKVVIREDTHSSPYKYGTVSLVQDGFSQVATFLIHDIDGGLWAYKTPGLSEGAVWEVKRKISVYESRLPIGDILSGSITEIDSGMINEINTLLSLDRDVLISCPRTGTSIGDYWTTIEKSLISLSSNDFGDISLVVSYGAVNRMCIANIYTLGGLFTGSTLHVEKYEFGEQRIDLMPTYDIPNSKVTFPIYEILQGVYFFEGVINIGGTVCRVGETINLDSMEKRKSITVMNDDGNTSLSLFLDYSSSRISLTNVFGTVPSITATDFKLIKL